MTHLVGKARSLETALNTMENALRQLGLTVEARQWLNPAPHIWSVHVQAQECPALFANGKGISREAALASAYGEFLERWMTGYFLVDYALPSDLPWYFTPDEARMRAETVWSSLPDRIRTLYEQWGPVETSDLPCLARCEGEEIVALPLRHVSREETVWLPWNLMVNLYASNGLAAGSTPLEARIQALSEILERWVRQRIILEHRVLPPVAEAQLAQFERVREARDALEREGILLDIRDASLGEGWPVVAIILYEREGGRAFVSFGAHPIAEVAIERTLTEAFQGRMLGRFEGYQPPASDSDWVEDEANLEAHFVDASGVFHWRFFETPPACPIEWSLSEDSTLEAQWAYLCHKVEQAGHDIYGADYEWAGFHACRLIVPGLSEVFSLASWLEDNHNQGCALRHVLGEDRQVDATRLERLLNVMDAQGWADHVPVRSLIGLAVDASDRWYSVRTGELRLWAEWQLGRLSEEEALAQLASLEDSLPASSPLRAAHLALRWRMEGLEERAWLRRQLALKQLYGQSGQEWAMTVWQRGPWAALPLGAALFETSLHQALWRVLKATRNG